MGGEEPTGKGISSCGVTVAGGNSSITCLPPAEEGTSRCAPPAPDFDSNTSLLEEELRSWKEANCCHLLT